MVLYIHSPIHLHGIVLNQLSPGTTLLLCYDTVSVNRCNLALRCARGLKMAMVWEDRECWDTLLWK
jgi:hypothetical protein